MKIYLLLLLLLPTFCHSQTTYKTLHIGDNQIQVRFTKSISVWETTYDSLIYMPKHVKFPFENGSRKRAKDIDEKNLQENKHEYIVDPNGMVYQHITTQAKRYEYQPTVIVDLVNDSLTEVVTPYHRHDTVMQIDPITLEEVMTVSIDSTIRVNYNLGSISKQQLKTDIGNKLGNELDLSSIQMLCVTDTAFWLQYYYHKVERMDGADNDYPEKKDVKSAPTQAELYAKLDRLKAGDKIMMFVEFKVDGADRYHMLYDLAVLTIKD